MDSTFATALCFTVLVLCPLVRGGCQEELMQDQGFMECVMGFSQFFIGLSSSGTDMSNPDSIFQVICSDEGKSAFNCILTYMQKCPELTSGGGSEGTTNPLDSLGNIPGFDAKMFLQEGGMDGVCALLVGPCSEVKKCIPEYSGMAKRDTHSSIDYFRTFSEQASNMCGPMKENVECMLKALESCPASVVSQVEAEFENAMKMSTPNAYGVTSFADTKIFVKNECSNLPEDTCLKEVFASHNFTTCSEEVSTKYSAERSCAVNDLSKQCINENVKPKCGEQVAMFLARNTHMIFPGTPKACNEDISGSDVKRTSFGILLISTLFTLLHIL